MIDHLPLAPKAQHFHGQPRVAPQDSCTPKAPALKARFIAMHSKIRRIETRFQRLFTRQFEFLGDAPGWH